jgi:hypothetical protein
MYKYVWVSKEWMLEASSAVFLNHRAVPRYQAPILWGGKYQATFSERVRTIALANQESCTERGHAVSQETIGSECFQVLLGVPVLYALVRQAAQLKNMQRRMAPLFLRMS